MNRKSLVSMAGFSILLAFLASPFAHAADQAFGLDAVVCDAITLKDPTEPDAGQIKISILTEEESTDGAQSAAAVLDQSAKGTSHSPLVLTGTLTLKFSPDGLMRGHFDSRSSKIRLTLDVQNGGPAKVSASHIKFELIENGRAVPFYDGEAKCGILQYASVGTHN